MRYVFVDDSIAYDGYTPMRRPLGGPEKAVASLATALSARGNDVKVINHTRYAHMADGAYYTPFGDEMQPKATDILIAMRKPGLLGFLRNAKHRLLWVPGAPEYLLSQNNKPLWDSFRPSLIFVSAAQQRAYGGGLPNILITPGVRPVFFERPAPVPEHDSPPAEPSPSDIHLHPQSPPATDYIPPAHAVVTTHPLHGLAWLIDLWIEHIHPRMPDARLAIYSAVLTKALNGEDVPLEIVPVFEKVKAGAAANIVVVEPRSDDGMAEVYRASRVHLYPGSAQDLACWTLAESQTTGLPAVARGLGGVDERIVNGQTGYIVPDAAAFANVTLQILGNDAVYKNLSDAARESTRRRTWTSAAEELEAFVATLPEPKA